MSARFLSRRRFTVAGLAAAGALAFPFVRGSAQDSQKVLRILGWSSYFPDDLTAPFQVEQNCRIEITPIATADDTMLFLRAGGIGLYDIVAPAIGLVEPLGSAGLLSELDTSHLANFAELYPEFQVLPPSERTGKRYGVPLIWGTYGLVYDTAVSDLPGAWSELRNDIYTDRLAMPDDGLNHLAIWNWALGADDPMRVDRRQLAQTVQVLTDLKRTQATSFGGSVLDTIRQVASGRAQFSTIGWQSAPLLTTSGQQTIAVAHPAPGGASFCDCISIVADSHDPELALAFVDFMLSAESQRNLIERTRWATVRSDVPPMIRPEVASLYSYDALTRWLAESPIRGYPPLGNDGDDNLATYVDWVVAWDKVRQAPM